MTGLVSPAAALAAGLRRLRQVPRKLAAARHADKHARCRLLAGELAEAEAVVEALIAFADAPGASDARERVLPGRPDGVVFGPAIDSTILGP